MTTPAHDESCALVIFGASGDLTKRKLIPALWSMFQSRVLPEPFAVVGVARSELTNEQFRARMRELAQRSYWDQFETMPEVVVMFVPVEASLSAAFQADRDLFEDAFKNKVLITSPIALFALLKAIAFGWQQQQVAENAEKIAAHGKSVYERLMTFAAHFSGIGRSLEASVKKYNEAAGSMDMRVLPAVRRLKELGVGGEEIEPAHLIETNVVRLPESRSD